MQGRQINALDGSCYRVGQAVMDFLLMVVNACTTLVFVTLLALISWQMTVLTLAAVLMATLAIRALVKRGSRTGEKLEQGSALLNETAVQALNSMRMIRIFGQEAGSMPASSEILDRCARRNSGSRLLADYAAAGRPAVCPALLGILVIAWYAEVGSGGSPAVPVLVFRLQRYARDFDVFRLRVASYLPAAREVASSGGARRAPSFARHRPFTGLREAPVFDRVGFVYAAALGDRARPALADVSLEIRRGETLALVGGSGAGKSTLINLLCRIVDPTSGEIRVDGVPLAEFDLESWRRRIGFAGQDAELRPGTIRDNIAYGEPDAPSSGSAAPCRRTSTTSSIPCPRVTTRLSGCEAQLSGGERQRIALARALLRSPEILILDEATNAVDNIAEAAICRTLEMLSGRVTTIIIAHRLSSTRQRTGSSSCTRAGSWRWTAAELLEQRGAFAQLLKVEVGQGARTLLASSACAVEPPSRPPRFALLCESVSLEACGEMPGSAWIGCAQLVLLVTRSDFGHEARSLQAPGGIGARRRHFVLAALAPKL